MSMRSGREQGFWWDGDRSEKYWIEQLKTDEYGDRLIAPDNAKYATMHGVEEGDLVLRWYSERHPSAGGGRSGIFAVSRAAGRVRRSADFWEGQSCLEVPLTPRTFLRRPIPLRELKDLEQGFRKNLDRLASAVGDGPLHSPWQFPVTGLKPMTRYLTKLTAADLELIVADHPHLATAMTRA